MDNLSIQVEKLTSLDLSHDIPSAGVGPISLNYEASFDSNFEDYGAFATGMNQFLEESISIKKLNEIKREGIEEHCCLLYTWRSITRALPSISETDPFQSQMYQATCTILAEAIKPLFAFHKFVSDSQIEFINHILKLTKLDPKVNIISDGIVMALGKVIFTLSVLDDLRNAKTSVKNDLSTYKRFKALSKFKDENPEEPKLIADVSKFLSEPYNIMNTLRRELSSIPDSTKIIVTIISLFCDNVENRVYISPPERYTLLRTILAGLFLVAGDKNAISRLEQAKASLSRIDRLVRDTPIIPLIGDMSSNVPLMLKRLQFGFEWSLLDSNFVSKSAPMYNILTYVGIFESEHVSITSELVLMLNLPRIRGTYGGIRDLLPPDASALYNLTLKSLKAIGRWNYVLQEIFFYKMSHPVDRSALGEGADKVDSYSLATKYNYNDEEKSAIARTLFFIKSLSGIFLKNQVLLSSAISMHIYNVFQDFNITTLSEIRKKTEKSKNPFFKMVVESLRLILSDNVQTSEPSKLKKGEKSHILESKSVPPGSTQMYMVKTMLNALCLMKKTKKHLESTHQLQIQAFQSDTAFFTSLLNLSSTIHECSQTIPLYFKEFYIEISPDDFIQYRIDGSFPYIINSHMITSNENNMYEFILYVNEIYNDAGYSSLHELKCRFLFDELDSEAQLSYQQICYHLSVKMYNISRSEAFTLIFDKAFKNQLTKRFGAADKSFFSEATVPYHTAHQFTNLCQQRSIQYLGRSVDLNSLLSQRLLIQLKGSLEACVSFFETANLDKIILLSALIDMYEQTHIVLTKNFELPPFKAIINEVNGDIPGYLSRTLNQIISSLINDVGPNYSYCVQTQRFVKSTILYTAHCAEASKIHAVHVYGSKAIAVAFEEYYGRYSKYIGIEHFQTIFRLVGYSGVAKIVEDLKQAAAALLDPVLIKYVQVLMEGMPMKCVLPRSSYGLPGLFGYYETSFASIFQYSDLRSGFLHSLRIFGNYIVIVYMLERAVYAQEANSVYFTAPFSGVVAHQNSYEHLTPNKIDLFLNAYKYFIIDSISSSSISDTFKNNLFRANLLNQEKLCCGLSIFVNFLEFLKTKVDVPFWKGPVPVNGVISVEECTEFHRLFSALNYYLTLPTSDPLTENGVDLGDGVLFGGLCIIELMGQRERYNALDFCANAVLVNEVQPIPNSSAPVMSSGTLRSTISKKTQKDNKPEAFETNRKIINNIKYQISKHKVIINIISGALSHRASTNTQLIKCFHPPQFIP